MFKKILFAISIIGAALLLVPEGAIDPWGLLNIHKILQLILFLSVVQMVSAIFIQRGLSRRTGGIALGFLSGLISSTAFTATLVRQSHEVDEDEARLLSLSYLSSLLGTVVEALVLVVLGRDHLRWDILYIFAVPIFATGMLIVWRSRRMRHIVFPDKKMQQPGIVAMLRLGIFITAILILSKALQIYFGDYGVFILTFVASLFELQGAVIANLQIYDSGAISAGMLGNVLAVGLLASYLSKLLLVVTLGAPAFRIRVLRYTSLVVLALGLGWLIFFMNLS